MTGFRISVQSTAALDYYPGGLAVPDPYATYPTWYVDAVNGVDIGSPGNVKSAGYVYQTYDNALLDVFYVGNPGLRRIVVKPTGAYIPGGALTANRGSYFPAGGPDAAHLCVIQGDPSNSTLPVIDAQQGGASSITGIDLNTPSIGSTRIHFADPFYGASRNPFVVNEIVYLESIVGTTQLNGLAGTVTATGGSAGAWTVDLNINSNGFSAYVSGGMVFWGGPTNNHPMFGIGNKGFFGSATTTVNNIVIRKIEMANSIDDCLWYHGGVSTNTTLEYCYVHGNRYSPNNPSSSGAIGCTNQGQSTSYLMVRYCKFFDMGKLVGSSTQYQTNCVPYETYGSDNVTFQNCHIDGAYAGIRLKLFQSGSGSGTAVGTANNYTIKNNIFSNNYNAILLGTGFTLWIPATNWEVSNNLVYGPALNVGGGTYGSFISVAGEADPAQSPGTGAVIKNNTIAEDISNGIYWVAGSGVICKDNVSLCSSSAHTPIFHTLTVSGIGSSVYSSSDNVTFATFDYNVYGNTAVWDLDNTSSGVDQYHYTSWSQWQAAYTAPQGTAAPTPPADFATLPGSHNPDANGVWIPNLGAPYNTVALNFPNAGTRDYTIAPGSPLLTASSSGGRVGYDPTNCGPGW